MLRATPEIRIHGRRVAWAATSTAITASGEVRAATGDAFEWRALDRVAVVGRSAGTDIHELLCRKGDLTPAAAATVPMVKVAGWGVALLLWARLTPGWRAGLKSPAAMALALVGAMTNLSTTPKALLSPTGCRI